MLVIISKIRQWNVAIITKYDSTFEGNDWNNEKVIGLEVIKCDL